MRMIECHCGVLKVRDDRIGRAALREHLKIEHNQIWDRMEVRDGKVYGVWVVGEQKSD